MVTKGMVDSIKQLQVMLAFLAVASNGICSAQSQTVRMRDPMFAIHYDPAKIHFDGIPTLLNKRCPALRGVYLKGWVYAHLKKQDVEYFLVSGVVEYKSEDSKSEASQIGPEEGDGLVVELRGTKCAVDAADSVFWRDANTQRGLPPKISLSDEILYEIATEMLLRYEGAFGGKEAFLHLIGRNIRQSLPPSVAAQLAVFEKSS